MKFTDLYRQVREWASGRLKRMRQDLFDAVEELQKSEPETIHLSFPVMPLREWGQLISYHAKGILGIRRPGEEEKLFGWAERLLVLLAVGILGYFSSQILGMYSEFKDGVKAKEAQIKSLDSTALEVRAQALKTGNYSKVDCVLSTANPMRKRLASHISNQTFWGSFKDQALYDNSDFRGDLGEYRQIVRIAEQEALKAPAPKFDSGPLVRSPKDLNSVFTPRSGSWKNSNSNWLGKGRWLVPRPHFK
ncbi:Uncharacterised protein [uncultured archaeon]|nr:Uncharacterised protein [uncultured archaeon]